MAIIEKPVSNKMKLTMTKTIDGQLKNISKTFSNVQPIATNDNVYTVGTELGNLQTNPVSKLSRLSEVELQQSI